MITRTGLERLYKKYNRREFVHPDPLEFLYDYSDVRDREIAGMVASMLAYGRVAQILKSAGLVLGRMGKTPRRFLLKTDDRDIRKTFAGFRHRFHSCGDISDLLIGIKRAIERHGSLEECFISRMKRSDKDILPALAGFVDEISPSGRSSMLTHPSKGSACKRLNLFLRWMVRRDDVDPGGWDRVPPSKLIVPLDTHMHKISRMLMLSARKAADMKTALEITKGFASISPDDPVKYDFALTRFGIRREMGIEAARQALRLQGM